MFAVGPDGPIFRVVTPGWTVSEPYTAGQKLAAQPCDRRSVGGGFFYVIGQRQVLIGTSVA
jgi:hypothetical protein